MGLHTDTMQVFSQNVKSSETESLTFSFNTCNGLKRVEAFFLKHNILYTKLIKVTLGNNAGPH